MDFDWKHVLRTETLQKSFLKTFYYNTKGTKKGKDFQKLSNKEIYFILQSSRNKHRKNLSKSVSGKVIGIPIYFP